MAARLGFFPAALIVIGAAGCSDESSPTLQPPPPDAGSPASCAAGTYAGKDGVCIPAGLPPDMACPPGELPRDDGACVAAGVPPDGCSEGFEHDGDRGCEPVLPAAACPPGEMAVPGDEACREPATCGTGTWGDIPVDASTEHVDGAYIGGGSDGTAQKPWITISEAVATASDGAIVAVAAGSYAEEVVIGGKPVRLWGRCPSMVEIVGTTAGLAAVLVQDGATGTEIHSLAARGERVGIWISGSEDVLVEGAWIHDNASRGVSLDETSGPTSATVRGSLLEANSGDGAFTAGSRLVVERSVVRGTKPSATGKRGVGINAWPDPTTQAGAVLTVTGSVVEKNIETGVLLLGAQASIEGSVIRDTAANAQGIRGWGVHAQIDADTITELSVVGSLFERNHRFGIDVLAADVIVDRTVVRDTLPDDGGGFPSGHGVMAEAYETTPATILLTRSLVEGNRQTGVAANSSTVTMEGVAVRGTLGAGVVATGTPDATLPTTVILRGCLVEANLEIGVGVSGADATLESTVVRGTGLDEDGLLGAGVIVQSHPTNGNGRLHVKSSLFEANHTAGVVAIGSDASVEASVVRGTQTDAEGFFGRGVHAEGEETPASVTLLGVHIDDSRDAAVFAFDAQASLDGCLLTNTAPNDQMGLGDGVVAASLLASAVADVTRTRIEHTARAAVATYGGTVSLTGSSFVCQSFDLAGNEYAGHGYSFDDRGGNLCGCPEPVSECVAVGAGAEAPKPIGGLE